MHDTIRRLREKHRTDEGFTLIELLVVVVIIGVLVAIAVPVYLSYRQGAADKSAQSDVRGAISTVEQYYTDNSNVYPASVTADNATGTNPTIPLGSTLKITLSDKTKLAFVKISESVYRVCATNGGGSGKWYLYDSSVGGSVKAAAGTLSVTTCA
jgi:type IV pilus assembly protein PilA